MITAKETMEYTNGRNDNSKGIPIESMIMAKEPM